MDVRKLLGIIIIAIGSIALMNNVEFIDINSSLIVSVGMLLVGALCLRNYLVRSRQLLLLIIAFLMIGWGIGLFGYEIRLFSFHVRNQFLLAGIALSFMSVYFHDVNQWWAIIPGGILFVVFVVSLLNEYFYLQEGVSAFLLFFGIGLMFYYLYLIRDENNRLYWAVYPAVGLIVFSLFLLYLAYHQTSIQIVLAVGLILVGGILIARALIHRESKTTNAEQAQKSESEHLDSNKQGSSEKKDDSGMSSTGNGVQKF